MRLFIHHRIEYHFTQPQPRLVQLLRLTPSNHEGQCVVDWRIDVDHDARLKTATDGFGNETTMLYVEGPIDRIGISISGMVLTTDRAGIVAGAPEPLPPLVFTQRTALTQPDRDIASFARDIAGPGGSPLDTVHRLRDAVHGRLREDVDAAHLFIATAREIGFPARYVSGHFHCGQEDRRNGPHGWAEAYVDGIGWIGFDPVRNICPDERYVRIATGLDSRDAAQVRTASGAEELVDPGAKLDLSQSQTQG